MPRQNSANKIVEWKQPCKKKAQSSNTDNDQKHKINSEVHEGIICDGCDSQNFEGARYKCIIWEDFDHWENCEKQKPHRHPTLKLRTPGDWLKFKLILSQLYHQEVLSDEELEEEKVSEKKDSLYAPRVIDTSIKKELICPVLKADEAYEAELISTMPKSPYTIDYNTKSVCVTCTMKNTGKIEWPSAFMIKLVGCNNQKLMDSPEFDELVLYQPVVDKSVKPGREWEINVMIQNPRIVGDTKFKLQMSMLSGLVFGTSFDYEVSVKDEGHGNIFKE